MNLKSYEIAFQYADRPGIFVMVDYKTTVLAESYSDAWRQAAKIAAQGRKSLIRSVTKTEGESE